MLYSKGNNSGEFKKNSVQMTSARMFSEARLEQEKDRSKRIFTKQMVRCLSSNILNFPQ